MPPNNTNEYQIKRNLAYIIGINTYSQGIPPLASARYDAEQLAEILRTVHGYEIKALYDEEATSANIQQLLNEMVAEVEFEDRVIFYFAGHGVLKDEEGQDELKGYFIPQDGSKEAPHHFMEMGIFYDAFISLEANHLLVILDCSFAGAFHWAMRDVVLPPRIYRKNYSDFIQEIAYQSVYRESYSHFIQQRAYQIITAAAYNQRVSHEINDDILKFTHSPFAMALFKALDYQNEIPPRSPLESLRQDGIITATKLYSFLRTEIELQAESVGNHQTPGISRLKVSNDTKNISESYKDNRNIGEFVFFVNGQQPNLEKAPPSDETHNPYRGLQPFEPKHHHLFFGRGNLTKELSYTVKTNGLTVVLGPSGAGKSSLVNAGLIPQLTKTQGATWKILLPPPKSKTASPLLPPPMRPGDNPIYRLQEILSHYQAPTEWVNQLPTDTTALSQIIDHWTAYDKTTHWLLVVDQFEELITICHDEAQRAHFIELLLATQDDHAERFHIVLTLRSDFKTQLLDRTALKSHLESGDNASLFYLKSMDSLELRQAIEQPALNMALYFESERFIERLIREAEVAQNPGALPLLSFTLSELYLSYAKNHHLAKDRILKEADYKTSVSEALSTRATQEYDNLPDEAHRATMKRVILRMISPDHMEATRRRVPYSELDYHAKGENQRVDEVVKRLVDTRLVVKGDYDTDDTYIEPAHDALIRAWHKIREWREEAEQELPLRLHQQLNLAANFYHVNQGTLWNNHESLNQLQQILEGSYNNKKQLPFYPVILNALRYPRVSSNPTWFNGVETKFVTQSIKRRTHINWLALEMIILATLLSVINYYSINDATTARQQQIVAEIAASHAQATRVVAETAASQALEKQSTAVSVQATAKAAQATAEIQQATAETAKVAAQSTAQAAIFARSTSEMEQAMAVAAQKEAEQVKATAVAAQQESEQAKIVAEEALLQAQQAGIPITIVVITRTIPLPTYTPQPTYTLPPDPTPIIITKILTPPPLPTYTPQPIPTPIIITKTISASYSLLGLGNYTFEGWFFIGVILSVPLFLAQLAWQEWQRYRNRTYENVSLRQNPYQVGPPIKNPDQFFGREQLISSINQDIFNNHIAIQGPRRSGKSSLLYQLSKYRIKQWSSNEYCFIPILFDLQTIDQNQFFDKLMRTLLKTLKTSYPELILSKLIYTPKTKNYDNHDFNEDLSEIVAQLEHNISQEIKFILLVDEGDKINNYDLTLQGKIRGMLSENQCLTMVWAGVDILSTANQVGSPWYNMFITYNLPPFTEAEAKRLITEPCKKLGYTYQDKAQERILNHAQGQPYIIQSVCHNAVEQMIRQLRGRGEIILSDVEIAIQALNQKLASQDKDNVVYQNIQEHENES